MSNMKTIIGKSRIGYLFVATGTPEKLEDIKKHHQATDEVWFYEQAPTEIKTQFKEQAPEMIYEKGTLRPINRDKEKESFLERMF